MIRLICYDISETKSRNKLIDLIEYHGFDRIQYSVFVGKIPPDRWAKCWKEIQKFHLKYCLPQDRIFCHVIERDHFQKMSILGEELDLPWILHETDVLFI